VKRAACHPERTVAGFGLCRACYTAAYRARRKQESAELRARQREPLRKQEGAELRAGKRAPRRKAPADDLIGRVLTGELTDRDDTRLAKWLTERGWTPSKRWPRLVLPKATKGPASVAWLDPRTGTSSGLWGAAQIEAGRFSTPGSLQVSEHFDAQENQQNE
jgi:hypothetical protein